jgi:hypothetical protein
LADSGNAASIPFAIGTPHYQLLYRSRRASNW